MRTSILNSCRLQYVQEVWSVSEYLIIDVSAIQGYLSHAQVRALDPELVGFGGCTLFSAASEEDRHHHMSAQPDEAVVLSGSDLNPHPNSHSQRFYPSNRISAGIRALR